MVLSMKPVRLVHSFVVESVTGPKSVSLEDPANFINNKLKEFDGKNVKVEIIYPECHLHTFH